MFARVLTATLNGIDGMEINVETDVAKSNMPSFCIVGLGDVAVRESKERIGSAIRNAGFYFPPDRVTVNLAPAFVRKEGTTFDLSIAVCMLISSHQISPKKKYEQLCVIGELSLSGQVKGVKGVLGIVISLYKNGCTEFIVPCANAAEAALVGDGVKVYPAQNLSEVTDFLCDKKTIEPYRQNEQNECSFNSYDIDMSDVKGHEAVKRAMVIAAAGGHNMLMIGPPGSGKSMLAKRFATLLPDMEREEQLEVTKIYSVAGKLKDSCPLVTQRPFRSPHHTVTPSALIGGGLNPRPGEVSYASGGVLFLDEFAEFPRQSLEVLRQPMQDGSVTVSRLASSVTYPSDFILLAGMNPCPCGYLNDKRHECKCSASSVERYRSHVSGPLLDRMDIICEVNVESYENLTQSNPQAKTSEELRSEVIRARNFARDRLREAKVNFNSRLSENQLEKYCFLGPKENALMKKAFDSYKLSARGCHRILKVSRTIADLCESENIRCEHIYEALVFKQT